MVKLTSGCLRPVGGGDHRHHGERGGDGGDADMAGKAALQRVDLLAHGARVADDAARPVEHPLALGGEALEARAALHQQHAERILELLDAGRERGLAHAAGLRRVAEMPLARQRDDEFELVDHGPFCSAYLRKPKCQSQGSRGIGRALEPVHASLLPSLNDPHDPLRLLSVGIISS